MYEIAGDLETANNNLPTTTEGLEGLEGTDFQMFRDLPLEIIKRRKDQMTVFKQARRQGMRASFSKSQPDKLFINGSFWPPGKCLDATEAAE